LLFYAHSENAGLLGLTWVGRKSGSHSNIDRLYAFIFCVRLVFHIALFYFLLTYHFLMNNQISLVITINFPRFSICHVLLKRLPFLFLYHSTTWSLDQFANRNLHFSHGNCSYGVAIYLLQENSGLLLPTVATLYCVLFAYVGVGINFILHQSILPRGQMMFIAIVCLNLEEEWQLYMKIKTPRTDHWKST
jgi:hypothetical protein